MYNEQESLTLGERLAAPAPKFFRILRSIGITLGSVGAAILASPVALPANVTSIAGYLITAGAVIAAVCSTTVDYKELSIRRAANRK